MQLSMWLSEGRGRGDWPWRRLPRAGGAETPLPCGKARGGRVQQRALQTIQRGVRSLDVCMHTN